VNNMLNYHKDMINLSIIRAWGSYTKSSEIFLIYKNRKWYVHKYQWKLRKHKGLVCKCMNGRENSSLSVRRFHHSHLQFFFSAGCSINWAHLPPPHSIPINLIATLPFHQHKFNPFSILMGLDVLEIGMVGSGLSLASGWAWHNSIWTSD
jgi:hypothetical protein